MGDQVGACIRVIYDWGELQIRGHRGWSANAPKAPIPARHIKWVGVQLNGQVI